MSAFPFGPVRLTLVLGTASVFAACAGGPDPDQAGVSHMSSHYSQVHQIQTALIAGDVGATRTPARWLSTHEGGEFPAAATPSLEMMRNEARVMLQQRDILPVSRTLGRMGVACGDCHVALSANVAFPVEEPPHTSANPAAHMLRHAWAMDRMWEGLVAPSDASWQAGAGALMTMPVDFGGNEQANRLSARVHELAGIARVSSTARERSDTYGDLVETCALCHTALRLGSR